MGMQLFDGHHPAEPEIAGQPDRCHAAGPDPFDQLKPAAELLCGGALGHPKMLLRIIKKQVGEGRWLPAAPLEISPNGPAALVSVRA